MHFFPYFDICKSMVTLLNVSSLRSCVEKWNKRVYHNQDTNIFLCFFFFFFCGFELRCMSNLWWLCGISERAGGGGGRQGTLAFISASTSAFHPRCESRCRRTHQRWNVDCFLTPLQHGLNPAYIIQFEHTQSCVCVCVLLRLSLLKDTDSECSDSLYVCVVFRWWGWYTVLFFLFLSKLQEI